MDEQTMALYEVAAQAAKSASEECTTIQDYTERIITAARTGDENAVAQYREVIGDELNHALKFLLLVYSNITGIEPDTDGLEDLTI